MSISVRRACSVASILTVALLLLGCDREQKITVYMLKKNNSESTLGIGWWPLNPITYYLKDGKVISNSGGIIEEYGNCTIASRDNWECRLSDGSGKFGVMNGVYWNYPLWSDVKIVSSFEYRIIKCRLWLNDRHSGLVDKFCGVFVSLFFDT